MGEVEAQGFRLPSTFEEGIKRLEEIVRRLESEDVPLEEHLELVREGLFLVNWCERRLKEAERRIERLVEEGGEIRFEPFEPGEGEGGGQDT
ncbi:MAG TPA: exodeoxyribonuclease VII small subunit [Armatimonadetes bacterium]|nr:exodeoxyribonuclease VII small subunit [Armatimonadota bacterium]